MHSSYLNPDLVARIEALAYRFWSLHPRDLDGRPPAPGWENRGGQRAAFYAEAMTDVVRDLARENAEMRAQIARLHGQPPVTPRPFLRGSGEGEPGYDFWAVVGLRIEPEHDIARAFVIEASPDCAAREIFVNGPETGENGDDLAWSKGRPSGLYLIQMSPHGGEDDFDLNVVAVSPLCPLGDDIARTLAEHLARLDWQLVLERTARPAIGVPVRAGEASGRYAGRRGVIEGIEYRVRLRSLARDRERRGVLVTLPRDALIPLALTPDAARSHEDPDRQPGQEPDPILVERELLAVLDQLEAEALGLVMPLHGLVYRVPLCHDGPDY